MIDTSFNVATNIISNAQYKADNAAQTIAQLPVQKQEVAGSEPMTSSNLFNPILSLKEAEQEAAAGSKVIETVEKMLGSVLDIRA